MTLTLYVNKRSRFALHYKRDDTHDHIVTMMTGKVDAVAIQHADFSHEWQDAEFANLHSRIPPTPQRFLEVLAGTHLFFTEQAIQALKEIEQMASKKVIYVTGAGAIQTQFGPNDTAAGVTAIDLSLPAAENIAQLEKQLGERALAAFVSSALALAKPLARVRVGDVRIGKSLEALAAEQRPAPAAADVAPATAKAAAKAAAGHAERAMGDVEPVKVSKADINKATADKESTMAAAKKAVKKSTEKAATTAAKKGNGEGRGPSVKVRVYEQLKEGRKTIEQLVKATKSNEVSVRTALSDLKNPKYAGLGGKSLKIARDESGAYYIGR